MKAKSSELKTKFIKKRISYDGSQLRSLYAYLEHGVLGHSLIAFRGPCQVDFSHMVDGEDLRERALIQGEDMMHFIVEVFQEDLFAGVLLQRLISSIAMEVVNFQSQKIKVSREGDDLYSKDRRKLSISIAGKSVQSVLIHFAVNVTNEGTPVKTLSLQDLGIKPEKFVSLFLQRVAEEFSSVRAATMKVRPL